MIQLNRMIQLCDHIEGKHTNALDNPIKKELCHQKHGTCFPPKMDHFYLSCDTLGVPDVQLIIRKGGLGSNAQTLQDQRGSILAVQRIQKAGALKLAVLTLKSDVWLYSLLKKASEGFWTPSTDDCSLLFLERLKLSDASTQTQVPLGRPLRGRPWRNRPRRPGGSIQKSPVVPATSCCFPKTVCKHWKTEFKRACKKKEQLLESRRKPSKLPKSSKAASTIWFYPE